jgi:copper chaperone CopZ
MKRRNSSRGAGFVQIIVVIVVILVVTMIALRMFQRTAPNLPVGTGGGHPARAVLTREEIRVEGLASEVDALQVSEAVRRLPGVAGAHTEYGSGMLHVTFDPARTNRAQLVAAVERAGFRAAP